MALKISLISIMMLIPAIVFAQCMTWLLCPYRQDTSDPRARYLSLHDINLRNFEVEWEQTDVEGREDELGQSVVCIESANVNTAQIEGHALSVGCTVHDPSEIPSMMKSPFEPRFNPDKGEIEFTDGFNERRKKAPIRIPPNMRREVTSPEQ